MGIYTRIMIKKDINNKQKMDTFVNVVRKVGQELTEQVKYVADKGIEFTETTAQDIKEKGKVNSLMRINSTINKSVYDKLVQENGELTVLLYSSSQDIETPKYFLVEEIQKELIKIAKIDGSEPLSPSIFAQNIFASVGIFFTLLPDVDVIIKEELIEIKLKEDSKVEDLKDESENLKEDINLDKNSVG